jgi:hypothetical protein
VRVRIKKKPDSHEIAEFDRRVFVVGETIEVQAALATLLIVGGYAEPVMDRWEAADGDQATRRRKKP